MKEYEKEIFNKSKLVYEENLKKFSHTRLNYPNENLVRLFSGKYIQIPEPPAEVMDHGFGHGNNLVFLQGKVISALDARLVNI